jgi:hypothetical protein
MTIEQIVKVESDNTDKIYLYREGLFLKAYNRSAFLFLKYGRSYEAFRKSYKVVGGEVAVLGFPSSLLSSLTFEGCGLEQADEDFVVVACPEALDVGEYELWFPALKLKTAKPKGNTASAAPDVTHPTAVLRNPGAAERRRNAYSPVTTTLPRTPLFILS